MNSADIIKERTKGFSSMWKDKKLTDNWQKLELSRCPRVEREDTVGRS